MITRSVGHPITINGMPTGCVAGGGYSGITDELDATVQRAAELLAAEFGLPVEIRFNSDRRSGGAFVRGPEVAGHRGHPDFGIGARVPPSPEEAAAWQARMRETIPDWTPETRLVDTLIDAPLCRCPSLCTEGLPEGRYAFRWHDTVEEALEFLKLHVAREALTGAS